MHRNSSLEAQTQQLPSSGTMKLLFSQQGEAGGEESPCPAAVALAFSAPMAAREALPRPCEQSESPLPAALVPAVATELGKASSPILGVPGGLHPETSVRHSATMEAAPHLPVAGFDLPFQQPMSIDISSQHTTALDLGGSHPAPCTLPCVCPALLWAESSSWKPETTDDFGKHKQHMPQSVT